ncbi:Dynein light chain-related protein [Trichophyton interdigitale]|nr:Dynein light chain-related protein [Trichophyton interdigitale]KAG5218129.1 Dynein light chain-related protein [Trichophyton interdigitale]KAG8208801.1 Dynein light chain-related protein [Trichophyton interdigitale]
MSERNQLSKLPEVPQHVAAQLSHLTSRPGVQSTLILSRKDGSIIQTTGLLAAPSATNGTSPTSAPSAETATPSSITDPDGELSEAASSPIVVQPTRDTVPYKPSPAETLAVHIHAFVSSASSLSTALSSPADNEDDHEAENEKKKSPNKDSEPAGGNPFEDQAPPEREDDDELKLLRLRTKIHEIIIIPDRKYLLCVVHDVSATAGGAGTRGSVHTRQ